MKGIGLLFLRIGKRKGWGKLSMKGVLCGYNGRKRHVSSCMMNSASTSIERKDSKMAESNKISTALDNYN